MSRPISYTPRSEGQRPDRSPFVAATVLSWPLLLEAVRKYLWFSDLVFVIGGLVLLAAALIYAPRLGCIHRELAPVYLLGWAYLVIAGIATLVETDATFGAFMVGAHALMLPLAYFLAVAAMTRTLEDPVIFGSKVVSLLSLVVCSVAVAQLLLGPEHSINRLPGDLGQGVYTWSDVRGIEGLFRPASIFTHTGKFGLVAFVLALFKLVVFFSRSELPGWYLPSLAVDLTSLFVSGQRAGWLLLIGFVVVAAVVTPIRRKHRLGLLAGGVALLMWGVAATGGEWFVAAIGQRGAGIPVEAAGRLESTFLRPWNAVLDYTGVLGDGLGMFTIGSDAFGGRPLYTVVSRGLPEGTWHRVLGESGFAGLLLFMFLVLSVIGLTWRWTRRTAQWRSPALIFLAVGLVLVGIWGMIHDTYANVTGMAMLLALGGLGVPAPEGPVRR